MKVIVKSFIRGFLLILLSLVASALYQINGTLSDTIWVQMLVFWEGAPGTILLISSFILGIFLLIFRSQRSTAISFLFCALMIFVLRSATAVFFDTAPTAEDCRKAALSGDPCL